MQGFGEGYKEPCVQNMYFLAWEKHLTNVSHPFTYVGLLFPPKEHVILTHYF